MPHIVIEYSANIALDHDIQALTDALHAAALNHGLAPLDGLRTRAVRRDFYRIADGDSRHAFLAIIARIGPGRDAGAKRSFVEALIDAAEAHLAAVDSELAVAFSAELQEINADFRVNRNRVKQRLQESGSATA